MRDKSFLVVQRFNMDEFNRQDVPYEAKTMTATYYCPDWPYKWPCWVGGNEAYVDQGQPSHKLRELKEATMKEF